MVPLKFYMKKFLSPKPKVRSLPKTAFPIRSSYQSQEDFYKLGYDLASGKKIYFLNMNLKMTSTNN
ncbi:hypothetical protein PU02_0533 [Bartonella ancashensis]|uniref:Uncharacterized protein n=1 Tax=Bartonella ancashensis TaxID=1318743 RepID=A0A0M4LSF4_9HYPH|nr:hypothetical protein PU02_0533 [Bartonella ancashensis]